MKLIKIFCVTLASLLICTSMTGCKALENMRQKQGFWDNDGNIILNGKKYIELNDAKYLKLTNYDFDLRKDTVYVTKPDVPVLLSGIVGESFEKYNKGMFLVSGKTYCREDKYDEITAIQENSQIFEEYCYTIWLNGEIKEVLFEGDEKSAIDYVIKNVTPEHSSSSADFGTEYTAPFSAVSKDKIFGCEYFLSRKDGKYFIENGDDMLLYTVPENYNSVMETIWNRIRENDTTLF